MTAAAAAELLQPQLPQLSQTDEMRSSNGRLNAYFGHPSYDVSTMNMPAFTQDGPVHRSLKAVTENLMFPSISQTISQSCCTFLSYLSPVCVPRLVLHAEKAAP